MSGIGEDATRRSRRTPSDGGEAPQSFGDAARAEFHETRKVSTVRSSPTEVVAAADISIRVNAGEFESSQSKMSVKERHISQKPAVQERAPEESGRSEVADITLVRKVQSGDRSAYRLLFERYHEKIFALAYSVVRSKEDAEDVTQDAFVKAYSSLPEFKGDAAFYTWLYRIAYNVAIDLKRKVSRRGGVPEAFEETVAYDAQDLTGAVDGPHQILYRKQQQALIQQSLQGLSAEHRAVIVLRELEGFSYEEIAESTGVSVGTVMSRLFYARKKLQQALREIRPNGPIEGEESTGANPSDSATLHSSENVSGVASDSRSGSRIKRAVRQIYKSMIF